MPSLAATEPHAAPVANRFVGRVSELASLGELLASGTRLVTLTGPGGIGKTRAALEILRARADGLFCDLTEARSREDICASLRGALQLSASNPAGRSDPVGFLGAALARRGRVLIVLDNFEQVIEHGPATIARWIAAAPDAQFLVTSRESLRLTGESVFELPPLALPAPGEDPLRSDAVQLLLDRAQRQRPGRSADALDRSRLGEIAQRLEGIPLALELAATRLAALGPEALLARLTRPLELLARGPRDVSARHRTVRAAIEWSWDLLDPVERSALAQCAAFRGGFDVAAADAVVDLSSFPNAPPVLDVVTALRDKSLLWTRDEPGRGVRFGMYVTIHEFAAAQLVASGAETATYARHAHYFADFAGPRPEETVVLGRSDYVTGLVGERENLAAATERGLSASPADRALRSDGVRSLLALRALDAMLGSGENRPAQIDRALGSARDLSDHALQIRLLAARGALRLWTRAAADGLEDLEQAVSLARKSGERRLEAWAHHELGRGFVANERPREGLAEITAAAALLRELGDTEFEPRVTLTSCAYLIEQCEFTEARRRLEELLARLDEAQLRLRALTLGNLGIALTQLGSSGARARFEQSLQIYRSLGGHWPMPWLIGAFAGMHHLTGGLDEAIRHFDEALALGGNDTRFRGIQLGYRALVLAEQGHGEQARDDLARAAALLDAGDDRRHRVVFQAFVAGLDAEAGDADRAAAALDELEAWFTNSADPMLEAVRLQRAHVDRARARAAEVRGDGGTAVALRESARQRIDAVRTRGEHIVHETRLALRLLSRGTESSLPARGTSATRPFVVHHEGRWFELPTGKRVICTRRPVLTAVLATLARARIESPGVPVSSDALIAAAWPGDRTARKHVINRLRVGIATLRKLGLRDVLQSHAGGYLFDPDLPLQRYGG